VVPERDRAPVGCADAALRAEDQELRAAQPPRLPAHAGVLGEAEEIAARTVNKERARTGEAKTASRTSTDDISSGRRGGLRSHRGPGGRTKAQLYAEAKKKGVDGRSKMTKAQLEKAVGRS